MNTTRHHRRTLAALAALAFAFSLPAATAQARPLPDDGPYAAPTATTEPDPESAYPASPSLNDSHCDARRVGRHVVKCDHPASAAEAPPWLPEQ
ncbi:hypothetical protein [Mumia sp. DW29H23]|uniref:hypothetical protein n=1 Tax=Mumia sp. DW29H23 TaxID=3421241 RepID=UPI003D6877F4